RGSSPTGHPAEPLVSYRTNRQLSGWNLPPLVIRAFGAHGHKPTCWRAYVRLAIPSVSDPDFDGRCEKNCSAQIIVIGELSGFVCALEQRTVVGCFLDREVNLVLKNNAKGVTPHINRAYPLAN